MYKINVMSITQTAFILSQCVRSRKFQCATLVHLILLIEYIRCSV